jgi:hypothetical protein
MQDVSTDPQPPTALDTDGSPPRVGKGIVAGLIGLGVCVLCLLPPIFHFVTGPLGPLIGGFAAGARIKARGWEASIIGMTIGFGIGLVASMIVVVAGSLGSVSRVPPALIVAVGGGAFLYASSLAWFGAWFAGRG